MEVHGREAAGFAEAGLIAFTWDFDIDGNLTNNVKNNDFGGTGPRSLEHRFARYFVYLAVKADAVERVIYRQICQRGCSSMYIVAIWTCMCNIVVVHLVGLIFSVVSPCIHHVIGLGLHQRHGFRFLACRLLGFGFWLSVAPPLLRCPFPRLLDSLTFAPSATAGHYGRGMMGESCQRGARRHGPDPIA